MNILTSFALVFIFILASPSWSQQTPLPASSSTPGTINKKLNLEDISVKGELLSDDRMNFVRRQREELKNRIKFRTNFREEILQEFRN